MVPRRPKYKSSTTQPRGLGRICQKVINKKVTKITTSTAITTVEVRKSATVTVIATAIATPNIIEINYAVVNSLTNQPTLNQLSKVEDLIEEFESINKQNKTEETTTLILS